MLALGRKVRVAIVVSETTSVDMQGLSLDVASDALQAQGFQTGLLTHAYLTPSILLSIGVSISEVSLRLW